jgi:hypothetical protein
VIATIERTAEEAANLIDLDSDPTTLIDLVAIGKQMLITRGALTTFSVANDVYKYFAMIPAMFFLALPRSLGPEFDAAGNTAKRDPFRADLQRGDHPDADPACVTRRAVSPDQR